MRSAIIRVVRGCCQPQPKRRVLHFMGGGPLGPRSGRCYSFGSWSRSIATPPGQGSAGPESAARAVTVRRRRGQPRCRPYYYSVIQYKHCACALFRLAGSFDLPCTWCVAAAAAPPRAAPCAVRKQGAQQRPHLVAATCSSCHGMHCCSFCCYFRMHLTRQQEQCHRSSWIWPLRLQSPCKLLRTVA